MYDEKNNKGYLEARYKKLHAKKHCIHEKCEKYARWTLPYVFPENSYNSNGSLKDEENPSMEDSIGARGVNHLSNRIVNTLFPAYRSFMELEIADEAREDLIQQEVPLELVDKALITGEKNVTRELDKLAHRTAATEAVKHVLITGNTILYYPKTTDYKTFRTSPKAQAYSIKDFCVVRDISGNVIEMILRDTKAFETFSEDIQKKLNISDSKRTGYTSSDNITLYTQVKLQENGKWRIQQAAEDIPLDTKDNYYAAKDLPYIALTWNLNRGEDYGRGLIEDYRGAFHVIEVLTRSLLEGTITAAMVKFLVNPESPALDIAELNSSPNGSFHVGRDGDVTTIKSDKHLDLKALSELIEKYTRQLGQVFLLNSSVTRNVERVTAEEIRLQAQELETAFGGIYSRFTEDWQKPLAHLMLSRIDVQVSDKTLYPIVVAGLDTLSRVSDLDNYRLFLQDLMGVAQLPEAAQQRLNFAGLIQFVGTRRGIDYSRFIKSEAEIQQEQQQMQQQQMQQQQMEMTSSLAAEAGKSIINSEEE